MHICVLGRPWTRTHCFPRKNQGMIESTQILRIQLVTNQRRQGKIVEARGPTDFGKQTLHGNHIIL